VSVVRADRVKRGLLFAGTSRGVFVSFDDGRRWQSLRRNLPQALVTDLLVHGDDLIAATQGRAIWVLDDVSPLRQLGTMSASDTVHLFAPSTAMRVRRNQSKDTPLPPDEPVGKNPPTGALIDYFLANDATTPIRLEIRDGEGLVIRRFASDEAAVELPADRYFTERWVTPIPKLSAKAGAHRFVWDLRAERPRVSRYEFSIAAVDGEDTPKLPQGMVVPPGDYQVVLIVGGQEYVKPLRVEADPRVAVDAAGLAAAFALSREVVGALERHERAALGFKGSGKSHGADKQKKDEFDAIGGALADLQIDLEGSDRAPTQPQRDAFKYEAERLERAVKDAARP
jgi:hypothetical protein